MLYLIFLILTACSQQEKADNHFSGEAMTMPYHIHVAHPINHRERANIEKMITATFQFADQTYNHWNPSSEIGQFNQLKSCHAQLISNTLSDLFHLASQLNHWTKGKFDPTLRPLIQRLKSNQPIPPNLPCGWDQVELNHSILTKKSEGIEVDFDAISKGYTIDLLIAQLKDAGYDNLYVEWAGEIKTSGRPNETRPWIVALRHPQSPYLADAVERIPLDNDAIATSGDYLQIYNHEEKEVSHIIDGHSHTPSLARGTSVAVRAKSCALADGLATSAMLIEDEKELQKWIEEMRNIYPETHFWVITSNKKGDSTE